MNREVNPNHRTANHLCDPTRLRAEKRRTQGHPVPRGGFHKAGEGPAFGGSLVTFCPVRKLPQRSASPAGALESTKEIGGAPRDAKPARFCIPFPLFFMLHLVEPFTIVWYTKR